MRQLYEFIFEKPTIRKLRAEVHESILFQELKATELNRVLDKLQLRSFKAKEHVFFEGDLGSALFIILQGQIKIVRNMQGKNKDLATLGKGMFFGEVAIMHPVPRTASAIVQEEALLACLFKHDLDKLVSQYPKLGTKLLRILGAMIAQRLAATLEKV